MTPDYNQTIDGLKLIADWIRSIFAARHTQTIARRADTQGALTSLMAAATETRQYMAATRRDRANQSYDKEMRIANLWAKAGIDMMPVNPDLASRCLLKSDYWSDTVGWTEAQKDDKLIKLDDLLELGRAALAP